MAAHRPEVGDVLLVIHDFIARSSDELTLAKGDRVELVERDDEFGDGWFLGKHLVNGNSGLFPEVYTRPAPKGADVPTPQIATKPTQSLAPPEDLTTPTEAKSPQAPATSIEPAESASPPPPIQKAPTNSVTLPLSSVSTPVSASVPTKSPPISSGIGTFSRLNSGPDNHVLHETLNVIDEHIDDLRSAPSNGGGSRHANDSGSEYSSHIDNRLSYIAGEETDEEEEGAHTRSEVESWTPDDVAEYLFTSGVEKHHCEVFRDQEITGEVLLDMDQTSLFIKAFDLGSVGRRLKTWHKVKTLQDEVNGHGYTSRPTTQTYGSEAGSEGGRRTRSRNNTVTGSLSRLPPIDDRPLSQQKRRSIASTPKLEPALAGAPVSPRALVDSPSRSNHEKRPSAASVRDLHYSRRHSSSTDFRLPGALDNNVGSTPKLMPSGTFPLQQEAGHKKQPSFDRNWTLGSAAASSRPLSGLGFLSPEAELQDSAVDLDRGYFSSAEGGSKTRNVLKKRDSIASHSHNSSYTEEQRVRSATTMARQSRGGSIGSIRFDQMSPAAQKYYGVTASAGETRRRTLSTNTLDSLRPPVPSKDMPPTVTKLDADSLENAPSSPVSSTHRLALANDLMQKPLKVSGLRAISDAVTGQERAKIAPSLESPLRDSPMESPARTGSTTPSAGLSFELDSPDAAKSPGGMTSTASKNGGKKKTKKETSAYTRGLAKISPREAMEDADYSGWMKKKSNSLMTTWKPRLFVLKGRRLAYYYSEDDEQEKGLIDISFHRVLPADNERLTGLHATLTGASNTPTMPANSNMPTIAASDADADTTAASDSIFIFKLVPPRAGLSRAVNFTKPTVHYFAVPNIKQGRFWMAALMKATIDRDDTAPIVTSYQQKTISLNKARQMRHRPPALMGLDEKMELAEKEKQEAEKNANGGGLGIYNDSNREDSAVAGLEKLGLSTADGLGNKKGFLYAENGEEVPPGKQPQSA